MTDQTTSWLLDALENMQKFIIHIIPPEGARDIEL